MRVLVYKGVPGRGERIATAAAEVDKSKNSHIIRLAEHQEEH